ncbi:hypothetical protein M0812_09891 [Anaeramoeba flamelloides]|uniref:Uncharacterized protein n=1 Tax=Anaeramoeba flamelloides TaxID=1746091 RepID=A0AAV7ZT70_9EUKA|nr:hypothetical protein M0812_09891 [Anaeramoeba flamelloides]
MNNEFPQLVHNTNSNKNNQLSSQNQIQQFERSSVQIIPKTQELARIMKENRHSAFIELSLRSNKTLRSIIRHLNRKWDCNNTKKGSFPNKMYRLKLFPVNLNFPQGFDLTNSHQITIDFLYKQLQVETLQIEYAFEIHLEPLRRRQQTNNLPVIPTLAQDPNQSNTQEKNQNMQKSKRKAINPNDQNLKPFVRSIKGLQEMNKQTKKSQNPKRKKRIKRFLIVGHRKKYQIANKSKGKKTLKTTKSTKSTKSIKSTKSTKSTKTTKTTTKKSSLKRSNTEDFQRKRKYGERTYSLPINVNLNHLQNDENRTNEIQKKNQALKKNEKSSKKTVKIEKPLLKQNNTNKIQIQKQNKNNPKKKRLNGNKKKRASDNKIANKKDNLHPLSNFLGLLGSINKNDKQPYVTTPDKNQSAHLKQKDVLNNYKNTNNKNDSLGIIQLLWKTPKSSNLQKITESMRTKTFLIPNEEISQDSFNLGEKSQLGKTNTPINENSIDVFKRYNFEDSFQYYPEQMTNQIFSPSIDNQSLFCSPSIPFSFSNFSYLNSPSQQMLVSPFINNRSNSKLITDNLTNSHFNDPNASLDHFYKSPSLSKLDPNNSPSPSKLLKKNFFTKKNNNNNNYKNNLKNKTINYAHYKNRINNEITIIANSKNGDQNQTLNKPNTDESKLTNFKRMLNQFDKELLPSSPSSSSSSLFLNSLFLFFNLF